MSLEVVEIEIDKIEPHPNNPRWDLGDTSELELSIKEHGILQNLEVVQHPQTPGKYRLVIGHRRFAAAKAVGLKSVPAVVQYLTQAQELVLMVTENAHRTPLTPIEEGRAFQGMLDLGLTQAQISESVSMSKTTVSKRISVSKMPSASTLNQELYKQRDNGYQPSFEDLYRVSQLEDVELEQEVLQELGTNNFEFTLKNAQKLAQNKKMIGEALEPVALTPEQITQNEQKIKHQNLVDYAMNARIDFIKSKLKNKNTDPAVVQVVLSELATIVCNDDFFNPGVEVVMELLGFDERSYDEDFSSENILEEFGATTVLLAALYDFYDGYHLQELVASDDLVVAYRFLIELGYKACDAELEILAESGYIPSDEE
jgi:ParB/RepB/Spo0J family partition protein